VVSGATDDKGRFYGHFKAGSALAHSLQASTEFGSIQQRHLTSATPRLGSSATRG
jgi:hypothetical protein